MYYGIRRCPTRFEATAGCRHLCCRCLFSLTSEEISVGAGNVSALLSDACPACRRIRERCAALCFQVLGRSASSRTPVGVMVNSSHLLFVCDRVADAVRCFGRVVFRSGHGGMICHFVSAETWQLILPCRNLGIRLARRRSGRCPRRCRAASAGRESGTPRAGRGRSCGLVRCQ
jgi:hypothetical protein